jgi:hypothetical protein
MPFGVGESIELFLGNIKGEPVWVPGKVVDFNESKLTYNIECNEFGKVLHHYCFIVYVMIYIQSVYN